MPLRRLVVSAWSARGGAPRGPDAGSSPALGSWSLLLVRLWPWVLTLLVLLPVLPRGFVLTYDMVFVPDLAFRHDFLGWGSGLPRSVPSDAVVAVLDEVLPGDLLQKVALLAALGLAGTGARRLVPHGGVVAQLVASTLYLWAPFVAERLAIGHWPLLLTYAALPWIHDAARRARDGERTLPGLVLWLALASLSASGGAIASLLALSCLLGRRRADVRRTGLVALVAAAINAPWVVAGAVRGSAALSDPVGVEVFAASGEGLLALPLALLGTGGIWNAEVVPPSRESWAAVAHLVLLLGLSAAGVRRWRRALPRADRSGLVLAAAVGVGVALAGAVFPGALGWLVAHVPGGGVLRDGSRFIALLAPLTAGLAGYGAAALVDRLAAPAARVGVATVLVLGPLALLPDLALGLNGRLTTVDYPQEYADARRAVVDRREAGTDGDVLLLPFSSYRLPEWNDGRRTLDPLGRYLTPDYLASDVLFVSGREVAGEDERAARVARLLDAGLGAEELAGALQEEGIAWVVLDRDAAAALEGAAPSADLTGLPIVHEGEALVVWELPDPLPALPSLAARIAVGLGWCAALVAVLGAATGALARHGRPRRK